MTQTEAFNEFLQDHSGTAYRMALQLTRGHEQDARDLVQEAWIKVWRSWEDQRPYAARGWIYRILHNLHVDGLRRRSRLAIYSLGTSGLSEDVEWEDRWPDRAPSLMEGLEKRELQEAVRLALERLPADFRVPIVLCDMEGLTYEEIARAVKCPVGTVRSRIHRGRRTLRQVLQGLTFRRRVVPALVAAATALGAWFLSKAQRNASSVPPLPVASRPAPSILVLENTIGKEVKHP